MTSRHLVDPQLLALIDPALSPPITQVNLSERRAAMAARFAGLPRPTVTPVQFLIPQPGSPDVPVLVYDPGEDRSGAAILHIHGGGMIAGRPELTIYGTAPLALAMGIKVVSVDYRLAPETPFPGPQEDCFAALTWLFDQANRLGISRNRIAISGESAGGGLAAALAIMTRDRGGPMPVAQFLTCPMLDHRTGGPDDSYSNAITGEFIWTREHNRFGWDALCGDYDVDDARAAWFSPALASDLAGLPPAWLAVGSLDLFFDESLEYARRLAAASVGVELHSYPGAVHGFNTADQTDVFRTFAGHFRDGLAARFGL